MRLIDAEKLIKSIEEHSYSILRKNNSIEKGMTLIGIKQCLEKQPTVDNEPVKHGHWIGDRGKNRGMIIKIDEDGVPSCSCYCSVCGVWLVGSDECSPVGRYCPNCGAKLE